MEFKKYIHVLLNVLEKEYIDYKVKSLKYSFNKQSVRI